MTASLTTTPHPVIAGIADLLIDLSRLATFFPDTLSDAFPDKPQGTPWGFTLHWPDPWPLPNVTLHLPDCCTIWHWTPTAEAWTPAFRLEVQYLPWDTTGTATRLRWTPIPLPAAGPITLPWDAIWQALTVGPLVPPDASAAPTP